MPIIQGAVAAGSGGAARAAGLTQLSEADRAAVIAELQRIEARFWSDYPAANNVQLTETGVSLNEGEGLDVDDITLTAAEEGDAAANGEEVEEVVVPPQVCWCGLISDEDKTRRAIMEFFEEPTSSAGAYVTSIVVLLCIVMSTITIVLESLPDLQTNKAKADFYVVEVVCIVVFSLEYVIRLIAVKDTCAFIWGPMNLIDIVAILPFYIDIIMAVAGKSADDLTLLRLLRIFRIFRIFKLTKYSSGIVVCAQAIMESMDTLGLMVFMCSISVCIFSSFEFFFESGEWNKGAMRYEYPDGTPSQFISIPASMWWVMVTIMTVGYGDITPMTWEGKIVAAIAMVSSIVIMALPISVIGANFSRAWMEKKEQDIGATDGRQLGYTFQNVLTSMIKLNSVMEEMLGNASETLVSLHKDLQKAEHEYARLQPEGKELPNPDPYDMFRETMQDEKLRGLVEVMMEKDMMMQYTMQKVIAVQDSTLEEQSRQTFNRGKELENYILRYQEISANIIGLEQVMFGRTLSVSGHH